MKVTIVGAENVGATCANVIATHEKVHEEPYEISVEKMVYFYLL